MAERITKDNYAEKIAAGTVLVDFYSDSCIPCKKLNPVIAALEEEVGDRISIYKVNNNFDMEVAQQFSVMSSPTLILFENGEEVTRKTGFQTKEALLEWLGERA